MQKDRPIGKILAKIATPTILFYALPWLMILLVIGTIMQKEWGLYTAHKIFFASWVLWLGPLPLPGGYLVLTLITISLFTKFIFFSPWSKRHSGIILSHLSILLLLIGGGVTAFSQKEGFLLLKEGQSGQDISDYHSRVIKIEKDDVEIVSLPFADFTQGDFLAKDILPFAATIKTICKNCSPSKITDNAPRHGLAAKTNLISAPEEKENEANLSGIILSVTGLEDKQNGLYATMEEIPHKIDITAKDAGYRVSVERTKRSLPFSVTLKDFSQSLHPGTDMARGFSSNIVVKDGDVEWPATISMNEPLRYKGYTLFQSSFSIRPDGEFSVFSVVENKGRVFPYISGFLMLVGLGLHLILRFRKKPA